MTKKSDDKGLLNEVLPDPTQAEDSLRRGTPRERTAGHLKKILAAAAGLALSGIANADTTTPPNKTGDKNGKKEGAKEGKKEGNKHRDKPPQPPPYGVVDPIPEPFIEEKVGPGWLKVASVPAGADIVIDGKPTGLTTPQAKIELGSGRHSITLRLAGHSDLNTVITVRADQNYVFNAKLETVAPQPPATSPPKP